MDQFSKTLVAGIAGTTVMTADSTLMSLMSDENFREPARHFSLSHYLKTGSRVAPTELRLSNI